MKIVYFIDHLQSDGTQLVLRQLTEGLARRGHRQTVVCLNERRDPRLVDAIRASGTSVRIVGKRALIAGTGISSTGSWLQQERFDVAVTLLYVADLLGRPLARFAGVPRIVSSIRARNINYRSLKRALTRFTMRWADAVVINSCGVREFAIAAEGAPPNRLHFIPNGIRVEDFLQPIDRSVLRMESGLADSVRLVGSVGRLTPQKGFDNLINALALVADQNVHLLIIGTGADLEKLISLARQLGLAKRVHFAGYRHDVPRLLGSLDLYVHPARFEGMPNAVLEAMAARCPIVATAVDGIPELIEDGSDGWLVPPEDSGALARAMNAALLDPIQSQCRATHAQERAWTRFSEQAMVDAWEKVLANV